MVPVQIPKDLKDHKSKPVRDVPDAIRNKIGSNS